MKDILVVDSDDSTFDLCKLFFTDHGFTVHHAQTGKEGLKKCLEMPNPFIFSEMQLGDMTGLEFIKQIKHLSENVTIVIVTQFGSIENAVEALQLGAQHYIVKPLSPNILKETLAKLKGHYKTRKPKNIIHVNKIIAESKVMREILHHVHLIAQSHANVFITGESGTGKEVIANALHYHSLRAHQSYIRVNCAAIPETLIESEFFGHEKGSFTGANAQRQGRFELAHEGSLLLDEVTEIPLALQAKLLRVVQEQEFERVGGTKSIKVNVRIISTSNRNMTSAFEEKLLREDLYYRLNVVPIHLPALRERVDDIIPLAEYFLEKLCLENQKDQKNLTRRAQQKLLDYHWPGNIRELANVLERAIVMYQTSDIGPEHIIIDSAEPPKVSLEEIEKRHILDILQEQQYNRSKAAKALGISVRKLNSKITEHKIDLPH